MALPLPSEINVHDSLDERVACRNFAGKTLDDAAGMFAESHSRYLEDLMFMGPVAFRFYVRAATRGLLATKDSDFARHCVGVLEHRVEWERADVEPVARHVLEVCEHVLAHAEEFGVRKTATQMQAEVDAMAHGCDAKPVREIFGDDFDWARYVDVERRYAELCGSLRQMDLTQ